MPKQPDDGSRQVSLRLAGFAGLSALLGGEIVTQPPDELQSTALGDAYDMH